MVLLSTPSYLNHPLFRSALSGWPCIILALSQTVETGSKIDKGLNRSIYPLVDHTEIVASGTESKGKAFGDHKRSGFAIPTPKFKRRAVSTVRDFPPGCGPSSSENRQIMVVHDSKDLTKSVLRLLKLRKCPYGPNYENAFMGRIVKIPLWAELRKCPYGPNYGNALMGRYVRMP
ncbi:histone-lysine N-methyltransferase, H3 lysine-9 specific SUVH6-like [Gossypium australe]|uniref:Histone-lysine N-methyltransferase, H3 lysine-9 specific SUVH6-like n=1 Tax=Gossypium australe TaxID=47621 RepID=A0A5B6V9G2_9ROSI|nr:histone-lysine N-methyltransferase, H3 lysine-9 specific SUVH6-like [Gossypium australe]